MDAVDREHGLYLVLASGLLVDHAATGSYETAVFYFCPEGDVNSFEIAISEAAGEFTAIYRVRLARSFFVFGRDIGGIDDDTVYALFPKAVMCPESRKAGLIDGMTGCAREIAS